MRNVWEPDWPSAEHGGDHRLIGDDVPRLLDEVPVAVVAVADEQACLVELLVQAAEAVRAARSGALGRWVARTAAVPVFKSSRSVVGLPASSRAQRRTGRSRASCACTTSAPRPSRRWSRSPLRPAPGGGALHPGSPHAAAGRRDRGRN